MREVSAVLAVALVIATIGVWTTTRLGLSLVGRVSIFWLCASAALCGALLAMISERAMALVTAAAVLAVVIFGGVRCYLLWATFGQHLSAVVSLPELALSDYVTLYVMKRGGLIFAVSVVFGILGAVLAPWQAQE